MQWWGYLHVEGTLQVKRFHPDFGRGDMDDAYSSPFCKNVVGPFDAPDRQVAINLIAQAIGRAA